MMNIDKQLLNKVSDIAREAGATILNIYAQDFEVEYKDDDSPLTQADRRAHEIIMQGLQAIDASIPVLSEEGSKLPYSERQQWQRYWLVDPLDGTKEFVKKNGEFTVNIALIEGHRAILGVVFAPVLERLYSAAEGLGAWRQDADREAVAIRVRPHQSTEAWKLVASRSHMSDAVQEFVERLGEVELLSMGSSLKLCLVAEGEAHLYPRLGPTSEWDTAASQCVVEQAGGIVVKEDLEALAYNSKDALLNPYFIVAYAVDESWTAKLNKKV